MNSNRQIEAFRSKLLDWSEENIRSFPWRETSDPFEILVAEILLQKTAAEKVNAVFQELLSKFPTEDKLAAADPEHVGEIIYSLGLQNQRSRALVEIAELVQEDGVPRDQAALERLPHVGRYAANATLCFAFEEPRPIVDANVVRVFNRIFDGGFEYRDEHTWEFASRVLPDRDVRRFNLALLDFAAEICTPGSPHCDRCFFTEFCQYYQNKLDGTN